MLASWTNGHRAEIVTTSNQRAQLALLVRLLLTSAESADLVVEITVKLFKLILTSLSNGAGAASPLIERFMLRNIAERTVSSAENALQTAVTRSLNGACVETVSLWRQRRLKTSLDTATSEVVVLVVETGRMTIFKRRTTVTLAAVKHARARVSYLHHVTILRRMHFSLFHGSILERPYRRQLSALGADALHSDTARLLRVLRLLS